MGENDQLSHIIKSKQISTIPIANHRREKKILIYLYQCKVDPYFDGRRAIIIQTIERNKSR